MQVASDSLEAAYQRGDTDRIAELVTPAVVVSPTGLPDLEGRESVRAFLGRAFESMSVETYHFRVTEAEVYGSVAYDRGTFTWEARRDGGPARTTVGRYHAVRRLGEDGVWRVHRLIENEMLGRE